MRIAIIGAGAMGSLFGSMLLSSADVFLIDPFKEHIQAIKNNGLIVETEHKSKNFQIFATTNPMQVDPEIDLAIIFTKSYDTCEAVKTAKMLLSQNGLALTLQNGLGNMDIISDSIGKDRTIGGVTSHGGTLVAPGHIRHAGKGPTYIAASYGNESMLKKIIETFEKAGIETIISENLDTLIWGKLIINVGINALAAILCVPNGVLGITPECENIMEKAVAEAVAVAENLQIKLPYSNPLEQVKAVCEKTAANKASMLQDILKGSRTEVGVINQAIVKKGKELGIATPCNLFLTEIIAALEATSKHRF